MTHVNHIFSTIMSRPNSMPGSPQSAGELCSNWWPVPSLATAKSVTGMPHPLCRMCANWLPDIEDIGKKPNKKVRCGNDWPKQRNLRSPLLPESFSPVPKEELLPLSTLNSSAPRTDQKFQ